MSKTNYNKMSSKTNSTEEGTIIGVDLAPEPDNTVTAEVIAEEPTLKSKIGTVTCTMLNVRKKPSTKAEVLTIISEGTEVEINPEFKHEEFYKVSAAATGIDFFEGYCMKKFIEVK